jgi:hypothetical protein
MKSAEMNPNVASKERRSWRDYLSWFVAAEFVLVAPLKFYPYNVGSFPSYFDRFEQWGYPQWFSPLIGAVEVVAGFLLIRRRTRFLGAVVVMFVMTGAVTTHIINHHALREGVSALVHFVLAVVIALTHWPQDQRSILGVSPRNAAGVSGR